MKEGHGELWYSGNGHGEGDWFVPTTWHWSSPSCGRVSFGDLGMTRALLVGDNVGLPLLLRTVPRAAVTAAGEKPQAAAMR